MKRRSLAEEQFALLALMLQRNMLRAALVAKKLPDTYGPRLRRVIAEGGDREAIQAVMQEASREVMEAAAADLITHH